MAKKAVSIFVSGHNGMVGSAVAKQLGEAGEYRIITAERDEVDLTIQSEVDSFFHRKEIDYVVISAARVGGIQANKEYPAEFIYENLMIETNLIHSSHNAGVERLLFLGSSCIYPRMSTQPIKESALLTGALEPTNEPYAIAKIAGIKLCESYNRQHGRDYRSLMPTNIFGPNDNFHPENSHVLPALLGRFHDAKISGSEKVIVWGSGKPKREFLHVDDLAKAIIHFLLMDYNSFWEVVPERCSHVNIGTGSDISISELCRIICEVVNYDGEVSYDTNKPDGTPRKVLDTNLATQLGWSASIDLKKGIEETYEWLLQNHDKLRGR